MTKALTEGERKRRKRGRPRKDGPRSETTGRLKPAPKTSRHRAAMLDALAARARLAGVDLPRDDAGLVRISDRQMRDLRQPWMGHPCGRTMRAEPDIAELWDKAQRIMDAEQRYRAAIDAPRIPAQRLGDVPPASPDAEAPPPRILSEEEATMAAVATWRAVLDALDATGRKRIIVASVLDEIPQPGIADAIRALEL